MVDALNLVDTQALLEKINAETHVCVPPLLPIKTNRWELCYGNTPSAMEKVLRPPKTSDTDYMGQFRHNSQPPAYGVRGFCGFFARP